MTDFQVVKEGIQLKKKIGISIAIIVVTVLCLLTNWFVIGEPIDGKQLAYTVTVDNSLLKLQVVAEESAVALRGWKFKQDGNNLFISARKVPVSFLFSSGEYQTSVNLDGIASVYLGGQIIWDNNTNINNSINLIENEAKDSIEEPSDERCEKIPWSDLDEDGTEEYILIECGDFLNQNGVNGKITVFVNNKPVYQYVEELLISGVSKKEYIDLDGDGEKEIFVSFSPLVNSMPLEEWFVLKDMNGEWKMLEMYHNGDDMSDNSFPIFVKLHKKPFELEISCTGLSDTILFDSSKHYERMKAELEQGNEAYNVFMDGSYENGSIVGGTLSWGVWSMQVDIFEGENCLIAKHGLCGPYGKYDYYGDVEVFFNYDENGKIRILNMEFMPAEH